MFVRTFIPVYGAQLARLVIPVLVLPIVARRLEVDAFAALMSAQALAYLVMLAPEYGFATYGARAMAQARGDDARLGRAAREIVAAKLVLCLPAAAAGALAALLLPTLGGDLPLVALTVALGLALGLAPGWFFQGVGRAQVYAFLEIGALAAFLLLVFLVPYGPRDAALVLALQAGPLALAVAIGHGMMARRVGVARPPVAAVAVHLRGGASLFVAKAASAAPGLGLVYLAGFLMSPQLVAVYAAAERVAMGSANVLWPVMQVVMPEIASRRAHDPDGAARVFRRGAGALVALGVALGAFLFLAADPIVRILFGAGYGEAAEVLRVAAFILPLVAVNAACNNGVLVVHGRDRQIMAIQVTTAVLVFAGAALFAGGEDPARLAWVRLAAETFAAAAMVVASLAAVRAASPAYPRSAS
ncbi:lipopolysaccharide biosynthesis protein [Salinarimonas rosea]|uniref:lipopolysaccharide biosynthesis protein n=1 Tax=Salinarimonas rosea TaxID=552063 RepID=UPI00041E82CA|nr:oligosaccharide flippase family protein [Salinarimonas rosea]